jgi:hypothetical protein
MRPKPCSLCGNPAEYSLQFLLSTLGRTPRLQKTTSAVLLCSACMQGCFASMEPVRPSTLIEPLKTTYTKFASHSDEPSNSASLPNDNVEPAEGTTSAAGNPASCGPHLIACNSRKFTQTTGDTDHGGSSSEGSRD